MHWPRVWNAQCACFANFTACPIPLHCSNSVKKEIVEEFAYFEDWMEKYEYLIELGKELKPFR